MKPFRENILVLLICPILCLLLSTFIEFCCVPLRPFPSHLLSKPNFLAFRASWFFCCCCLDCCFVVYLFFGWFSFFCLCLLFGFEIMTTNANFTAILGFFKRWYCLWYRKRVSGNSTDVLLVFSPQSPLFKNTRGLSFSLVSFLLSSISTFQGLVFVNPTFELTLSFRFSGFVFRAPLLSSFLLRSFQPISCHPLLQSTLFSFLVVSLLYSSSVHAIFSGLAFPSCIFLVGFCLVCFWLLLSPFFSSLGILFLVSRSDVFGGETLVKVGFVS